MSKLKRDKEQRKADREQKRQTPKVKMRSYGGGEKLPIVQTGKDFYLADQKYDNLGHGEFEGQMTGKLQGPSKRAIKGKGKKSANVRVGHGSNRASDDGDAVFLEDTSTKKMKNDYSSMKSMGQAIASWTSPNKLTGKASPIEQEGLTKSYYDKSKRKEQKEKYKDIDKKEAKEKGVGYKSDKKIERQAKKDIKKDYKESDEGKAEAAKKKAKLNDAVNQAGRAMEAFSGKKPSAAPEKTKTKKLNDALADKKAKEKAEEEKKKKQPNSTLGSGDITIVTKT